MRHLLIYLLMIPMFFSTQRLMAGEVVAGHEVAKESVLRAIPQEYIDKARQTLHIAYQHTSHGTQVAHGMYGLQEYKNGDDVLFGIQNEGWAQAGNGKLDFHDYAINKYPYNNNVPSASDLSVNETAFLQLTRNYLDHEDNQDINVVMWSWCNIAGHDVEGNYLPNMRKLIEEYGPDGSKVLSGARKTPVTFIFMTGHANYNNNIGDGNPKNQAELIVDYCRRNGFYCLDYYSIDSHDMAGHAWDDAGDDGNSPTGGKFYQSWQDSHEEGVHWYRNKISPYGNVTTGEGHNTQYITANRKAYAMWWILARIAGWDGGTSDPDPDPDPQPTTTSTALQGSYLLLR